MPTSRRQKPCLLMAGFIGRRLTGKSDMGITECPGNYLESSGFEARFQPNLYGHRRA